MENIKEVLFDPIVRAAWEISYDPWPYIGFLATIALIISLPYLPAFGSKIRKERQKFIEEREGYSKKKERRMKRRMTRTRAISIILIILIPAGTVWAEDSLRYVKPDMATAAEKNLETAGKAIL